MNIKDSDLTTMDPDALYKHAFSLHQAGNARDAIPLYQQLHTQFPENTDILTLLGTAYLELENIPEGIRILEHSLKILPNQPVALSNLANSLYKLGRFEESVRCCDIAIDFDPGCAAAHNNRADALIMIKKFDEALISCERAISLKPDFAEAYCSRGSVLCKLEHFDEALANYDSSILLSPDLANAYSNRAIVLNELGRFDEALISCGRAVELKPDFANAQWNKSLIKLTLGDFEEGWKLYEWRWKSSQKDDVRVFDHPLWLGDTSLSGKTILIYPEQGLGDVIQASRYVYMLNALGAKVILEVPASLTSVIKTLQGNIEVIETGVQLPAFDFKCPIMSLPLAFKTTVETIPGNVPYLFSDSAKQKEWHDRLGEKRRHRIGIVCSGSTTHKDDSKRSIPLKLMLLLLNLPFEFHLLQKEIRSEDAAVLSEFPHVKTHHQKLNDFSDTASLINEMDLVISVDTSVAHLAGALGKPIWLLLSWVPDFRWLLDRTDSPWYPTATLFRQPERGDWESVIEGVFQRLQEGAF